MRVKARRSLGQSLEAVLKIGNIGSDELALEDGAERELKVLKPDQIIPGKYQPRREFDLAALQSLSDSIREQGIIQPLIVRAAGNQFEIIAGERRWRAAKMAELQEIPVVVCNIDDTSALAYGVIENIQRKDLNPIEEAQAYERLIDEFGMTHEEVAKAVGRSRSVVTNMLRLLNLGDPIKEFLIQNKIEMGHARALLSLSDAQQLDCAHLILSRALTVRETEKLVNQIKYPAQKKSGSVDLELEEQAKAWEIQLSKQLFSKVDVNIASSGKGRVVIHFDSLNEANKLMERIGAEDAEQESA